MNKYNISDEQIKEALSQANGVISEAARNLNIPRKTFSNWVHNLIQTHDLFPESKLKLKPAKKAIYIITSAQNNTKIHSGFFESLKSACNYYQAQLLVTPLRYKNVNAYINNEDKEVWWPPELEPYYLNSTFKLNKNLAVLGDLKVQATACDPLSGLEIASGRSSVIVGHPRVCLRMVPSPSWAHPKQMMSTGSISLRNYSISKAGKVAETAHRIAATIVEVDGDCFWARQITANEDGSFYDLDLFFDGDKPPKKSRVAGISIGDLHVGNHDEELLQSTWGEGGLIDLLQPDNIYLHDVLDFYSQSHHSRNDFLGRFLKREKKKTNVGEELNQLIEFHNSYWGKTSARIFYIPSNHHDHLYRWLNEGNPKDDLENALVYHELMFKSLTAIKDLQTMPNPLELFMRGKLVNESRTFFPARDEKVELLGNAIVHGDKGANGAKPSPNTFAKSGFKFIYGHTHTNSIMGDGKGHGTNSKLNLDYNLGLTNWVASNCIIYLDGNTSIINYVHGSFYAFRRRES